MVKTQNYFINPILSAKLLIAGFFYCSLLLTNLISQPFLIQECDLTRFDPDGFVVKLDHLPDAPSPDYVFQPSPGIFRIFDNQTALVTGRIINIEDSTYQWDIRFSLVNELGWPEWSALGRGFKSSEGSERAASIFFRSWTFWELDDTDSYFVGVAGSPRAGDTLFLRHRPNDLSVGFQLGRGANDRNENVGFSGWFDYSFSKGDEWSWEGSGDINVNSECRTFPCNTLIEAVATTCNNQERFSISLSFSGNGEKYVITDGTDSLFIDPPLVSSYEFGDYPSDTIVSISIIDLSKENCIITVDSLTQTCQSPRTCGINRLLAEAIAVNEDSFEVQVSFEGDSGIYLLEDISNISDSLGTESIFISEPNSAISFGKYVNGTNVIIRLADTTLDNCSITRGGLTVNPLPSDTCDVSLLNATPNCIGTTGNFNISLTFSGSGTNYRVQDSSGAVFLNGIEAGDYEFGFFNNQDTVFLLLIDNNIPDCILEIPPITTSCVVCDLSNININSECINEDSVEVSVSFSGSGDNFRIIDNLDTPPLNGLIGDSTYVFGRYTSSETAIISVFDPAKPECDTLTANLSPQNCIPCEIDSVIVTPFCDESDEANFYINVTIEGNGDSYTVRGLANGSALPISNDSVSAGSTIPLGPFPNNASVVVSVIDNDIPNCSVLRPTVTEDCTPEIPENDVCEIVEALSEGPNGEAPIPDFLCGDIIEGTTKGATEDPLVCAYCGTFAESPGVWYNIEGTGEIVSLTVCSDTVANGDMFDTRLMVFEFGCDTLSCVTGNDITSIPACAETSFLSEIGREYLIFVTGGEGTTGKFTLEVGCSENTQGQVGTTESDSPELPEPISEKSADSSFTDRIIQDIYIGEVRPNPASTILQTDIISPKETIISCDLYNTSGQFVSSTDISVKKGVQDVSLNCEKWAEGMYIMHWRNADQEIKIQRIVILRNY